MSLSQPVKGHPPPISNPPHFFQSEPRKPGVAIGRRVRSVREYVRARLVERRRTGARRARLRRASAQPAAHAPLRAPRHVQALWQAERAAAEE